MKTSNLCTEIVQYSSSDLTAVCTLASIAAPEFVLPGGGYDFDALHEVAKLATRGADALLDAAVYPTTEACTSAFQTRDIGVGIQGLADVFMASGIAFESAAARELNIRIFEALYHASYEASCEMAQEIEEYYPLFPGSPASAGRFQHDMWAGVDGSGTYDFEALRVRVKQYGLRNAMLTAQMPTASTARLLGNSDGTDPYTRYVWACVGVFITEEFSATSWFTAYSEVTTLKYANGWSETLSGAVCGPRKSGLLC